ncbi:MAG: type VI secretion system tube protein Hcp [Gammaproteobacteria bacterium]|nr:type VI secretion system tube protein Hcp [Gammaproteobacteria bacterium]
MAIYFEIDGIKGNVTNEGYKNMIEISFFNFSVGRAVSMTPGVAANRESGTPQLSEIQLTKKLDNSSPHLFNASVAAAQGKTAKLHFVRTSDGKSAEFMTYELNDCVVSGYSISAEGGDAAAEASDPTENVTLSYTKLIVSHTQYDKTNKVGQPIRSGYDLALAKAL